MTGEEQWTSRATDEVIVSLAFSPDATVLASGAGYGETEVRLWDVSTGQRLGTLTGHRGYITHLSFWPDGATLASASSDQTIRLWDLSDPTNPRPLKVLRGHQQEVWRLALLADERTLVSGAKDGTILVWDTAKDADIHQAVTIPSPVRGWCFSADSQSVLILDPLGRVSRWTGDQFQNVRPLVEVGSAVFRAKFSDDGEFLATGSVDGVLTVWDLRRCRQAYRLTVDSGPVAPGAVSLDGKRIWLGCFHRNTAEEWDLDLGRALWSTAMPADTRFGLRSADGTWGLAVGSTGEFLLRNSVSGAERRSNLQVHRPSNLAFSPDGSLFAVASYEGWARLFETPTLKEVAVLRGFLQGVHSVAFSPDGRRLATGGSGSETIRLWDTGSGQQLLTLESGGSLFNQTAFAPDGSLLGSSSEFGVLHIWRAPDWREIDRRSLTLRPQTVDPQAVHDRPPTEAHVENEEQP
jgi:WD40 repeat protein